jgi:hypothetical protein
MPWTWHYTDSEGQPVDQQPPHSQQFPTQSDAETWIGETWQELLDSGVEGVVLFEDDHVVYGPMSLRPID